MQNVFKATWLSILHITRWHCCITVMFSSQAFNWVFCWCHDLALYICVSYSEFGWQCLGHNCCYLSESIGDEIADAVTFNDIVSHHMLVCLPREPYLLNNKRVYGELGQAFTLWHSNQHKIQSTHFFQPSFHPPLCSCAFRFLPLQKDVCFYHIQYNLQTSLGSRASAPVPLSPQQPASLGQWRSVWRLCKTASINSGTQDLLSLPAHS